MVHIIGVSRGRREVINDGETLQTSRQIGRVKRVYLFLNAGIEAGNELVLPGNGRLQCGHQVLVPLPFLL